MGKQDRIYQEKEIQEATAAGGGASTGAFSGTFMQPIRREMPEGLNLPKKPIPQYATIMYRDGGNYKSFFLVELPIELYQRINFNDNGEVIPTEFEIEDFGIDPETLWNSTGSDYDEELDHNLVDVIDVHNDLPDNGLIELSEGLNLPKKRSVETFKIYHDETNEFIIEVNWNELSKLIDEDWVWYDGTKFKTFANAMILYRQVELYQNQLKEGLNLVKKQFKQYYVYDSVVGENFVTDEDGVIARAVELRRQFGDLDDPSEESLNDIDEAIDYLYSYNYKVDKYTGQDLINDINEGLNLVKRLEPKQYLVKSPHVPNFEEEMTLNELIDFAKNEQIWLYQMNPRGYPGPKDLELTTGHEAMEFLIDFADYEVERLTEGLNLPKKQEPEPLNWHVTYDELHNLGLEVDELEEICEHYGVSTIQSNGDGPIDYHWTLEELVDYFQQHPNEYHEFMAMRQTPLESEMDEGTDIGSVGAGGHGSGFAYIDPYGKGHKTRGTWAKNEASMYHNRKPYWPGGSFVTVKKKCQKFPYCNQGDTGALNFSNPKAARSQSLREGLNLPKKLKSDYTISVNVEEFNLHRGEYSFIYEETIPAPFGDLEDVKHLCNQMLKRV
jgi:hypothetical protein